MLDFPYSIGDILIFIGVYLVLPGFCLWVWYYSLWYALVRVARAIVYWDTQLVWSRFGYSLWYALVRVARAIVYRDTPTKHETDVSRYVMKRSYLNYMFPALDQWHTTRLRPDERHIKAHERESLPF